MASRPVVNTSSIGMPTTVSGDACAIVHHLSGCSI
jgi:hypothetical protein